MDDLLALFDASVEDTVEDASISTRSRPNQRQVPTGDLQLTVTQPNNAQHTTASVDDRIGIRMLNRKVPSAQLMELITDYPYHSTSQLSAYSLSQLNSLLIDPAMVVDGSNVNGKTNLLTLGIVFTNSGSRVGPSGKAYCILTVGNLTTGPTVSILLFGACYHAHCRLLHPGKVVAMINPRLMSPKATPASGIKATNRPTVTFSVSDESQLKLIGDARDYGSCKAMISSKNESGHWVKNGAFCKNFVDKRLGNFCSQHHNQAVTKDCSSIAATSVREKPSSLQQLRVQAAAFPSANVAMLNSREVASMRNMQNRNHAVGVEPSTLPNSLLACRRSDNVPGPISAIRKQPLLGKAINPYAGRVKPSLIKLSKCTKSITVLTSTESACKKFLTIDLEKERKRQIAPGKSTMTLAGVKRRAVNTDTAGFNGSVPIPGPSKLFSHMKATAGVQSHTGGIAQRRTDPLPNTKNILARQEQVAAQLKDCHAIALNHRTKSVQKGEASLKETLKENLFESAFYSLPMEGVISAKSKFACEADAELYARSRQVVAELEEKEYQTLKKSSQSQQDCTNNKIEKEWFCQACKKKFTKQPVYCLRMQHPIQVQRTLREIKSKADERLSLTEKNPEDGGFVLGRGLEWSRYPRFS